MIELALGLLILLLIAIMVIYFAFTPSDAKLTQSQQITNKAWYQEALSELMQQQQAGLLSAAQFEQEKAALQKNVANFATPQATLIYKKHTWLFCAVVVLFVIAALAMYLKLGASKELSQYYQAQAKEAQAAKIAKQLGSAEVVINQLKARLAQDPNQAQGWYLLGRLYFSQNQFDNAVAAFEKAGRLAPDRADIAIQLAEAAYLANDKATQKQTNIYLKKALSLSPQDPAALNLQALMAYHDGHYQDALAIWQNLLLQAPQGSDSAIAIQQAIDRAEAKLSQSTVPSTQAGMLSVTIDVTPAIAKHIQAGDVLLVYAKAENGPPMPLAIKRLAIEKFPYQVSLSDADAMMPTMKLSNVKHVIVYARVSKSGQAMPQKGDLEGQSAAVSTQQPHSVDITIDKVV